MLLRLLLFFNDFRGKFIYTNVPNSTVHHCIVVEKGCVMFTSLLLVLLTHCSFVKLGDLLSI